MAVDEGVIDFESRLSESRNQRTWLPLLNPLTDFFQATFRRYEHLGLTNADCEYYPKLRLQTGAKIRSDEKLSARGYVSSFHWLRSQTSISFHFGTSLPVSWIYEIKEMLFKAVVSFILYTILCGVKLWRELFLTPVLFYDKGRSLWPQGRSAPLA